MGEDLFINMQVEGGVVLAVEEYSGAGSPKVSSALGMWRLERAFEGTALELKGELRMYPTEDEERQTPG